MPDTIFSLMRYSLILFDLDNTLMDFSQASKTAFEKMLHDFGVNCQADYYAIYHEINVHIWKKFERKDIDTDYIRENRFKAFFEKINAPHIDSKTAHFKYIDHLIHASQLYPGVEDLLSDLHQKFELGLITNGLKEAQRPRIKLAGIEKFFSSITISDEIGVAKPSLDFFDHALNQTQVKHSKDQILVVGDSLTSDIAGGHGFGVNTCWIGDSPKNGTALQPTYVIDHVLSIKKILGLR